MGGDAGGSSDTEDGTNGICRCFNTKSREGGQMLVKGAIIPEIGLTATNATMTGLNGITDSVIPADNTAGIVGNRTTTANFVKTVAFFGIFIIEGFDK